MKSVFAQRFEDECGDVKVAFKLPDGEKLEHWFPRCSCVRVNEFSLLYLHKRTYYQLSSCIGLVPVSCQPRSCSTIFYLHCFTTKNSCS